MTKISKKPFYDASDEECREKLAKGGCVVRKNKKTGELIVSKKPIKAKRK